MAKIIQRKSQGGFIINKTIVDIPITNISYDNENHLIKLNEYELILTKEDVKFITARIPKKIESYIKRRKK
jgi:hypothetical protein|tara:strand:- start:608 stop:820 length:213 start_codon:yes stop_codon:yes gene_type:complete